MGNENTGRKVSKTVGNRKKLLDITNTPILLKSRIHNNDTSPLVHKGALAQLQEDLANVKKMLEEKEENLAESKSCIQKLWSNYCRKSKQNDEIIFHNSQLNKELSQARDQLKVLQHENIQMSAVYKACKSEMQEKLNEALEEVNRLMKLVDVSSFQQASNQNDPSLVVPGHSCDIIGEDSGSTHSKSLLRKRERQSYKEPSLKVKLRQMDGGDSMCRSESFERESNPAVPGPAESQGSAAVVVSAACNSEMERAAENGRPTKASQTCTEKGQTNILPTSHEVCERPRRRAASSSGSYKEPPLNTKMRRAA